MAEKDETMPEPMTATKLLTAEYKKQRGWNGHEDCVYQRMLILCTLLASLPGQACFETGVVTINLPGTVLGKYAGDGYRKRCLLPVRPRLADAVILFDEPIHN